MANWKSPIGRVRLTGMMEAVSFLLLLGVAMPLKYLVGIPDAVKWTGWVHGLLFVIYCLAIFSAWAEGRISFSKSVLAFLSAFFPLGPFFIDRKLVEAERAPDPSC